MKNAVQDHQGKGRESRDLLPLLRRGELPDERRQRCWDELELPPPGVAPLGFAARVAAQVRLRAEGELRWSKAPRWARLAAAAALLVGATGGVSLGLWQSELDRPETGELAVWTDPASLADGYWLILEPEDASQDEVSR